LEKYKNKSIIAQPVDSTNDSEDDKNVAVPMFQQVTKRR
jgi:hypothetical protein